MDQTIRNKLRAVVTQCRKLLEDAIAQELEGKYGIFARKDQVTADPNAATPHLQAEETAARKDILDHFEHIKARGFKPKDALDQLIREIAFTHLNRLCAYKMMEAREVYVGGRKFREAVSRGVNSNGVKFYLAEHLEDERLFNTGHQDVAYRHFLDWLGRALSEEIGVLFSPNDPANRLYPRQKTLDEVLDLLNNGGIKPDEAELREAWPQIWSQDETIGWVYQYFTPKELREKARKESQAPRNSYELAFRNQLFTPRYVVEFLTDNTLGRIWYEMRLGNTKLKEQCRYLVRWPDEVFLAPNTAEEHRHDDKGSGTFAKLLQTATPDTFPPFDAEDENSIQRMIEMAHCVSAFDQFGENVRDWYKEMQPRVEDDQASLVDLSTADLFHYLFITCRNDRQGGFGAIDKGKWLVNTANEIRRRVLSGRTDDASQEDLLKTPVFISYRRKKDPRELKILDPACGSGHFLLYCFDLLLTIYEEAYSDPDLGPALQRDYPTLDDLRRDVPRLILANNLHGIDIDLRASQIAALALWLRCQRAYQDMGLKKDRPKITRSNFVCAEPMPGETQMLKEFVDQLEPRVLGQVVEVVFDKMKLAGEAGSLLKIEEEIRDTVAAARKQWDRERAPATDRRGQPLLFAQAELDRLDGGPVQQSLFDLSDITDAQFFEQAESKVIDALRRYAEGAHNGKRLQRRLFAEDAVRGFAFVDLCQKRYDVVLMNPPFGDATEKLRPFIEQNHLFWNKNLLCAFVSRAHTILNPGGLAGTVYDRTANIKNTYESFRRHYFLGSGRIECTIDLGWNVLDANVEVSACTFSVPADQYCSDASLNVWGCDLTHEDLSTKRTSLLSTINTMNGIRVSVRALKRLPNAIIGYYFPRFLIDLFARFNGLEQEGAKVFNGHTIKSDEFFRYFWELPTACNEGLSASWSRLYNGGSYSRFFLSAVDVVYYGLSGKDIAHHTSTIFRNLSLQQKPGVAFGKRGDFIDAHLLREGFVSTVEGQAIALSSIDDAFVVLALLNSDVFQYTINTYCGQHKYPGYVNLFPVPNFHLGYLEFAGKCARDIFVRKEFASSFDETSPLFVRAFDCSTSNLTAEIIKLLGDLRSEISELESNLNNSVSLAYGLNDDALNVIAGYCRNKPADSIFFSNDAKALAHSAVSYAIGCVFGRWDIRFATGIMQATNLGDPFAPLPTHPQGALLSAEGVPAIIAPEGYPLRIEWDGILTDELNNSEDLVGRVRDVIESAWRDASAGIEREACEILGVAELRDYFRKPGKGGFWDDHIALYSKSRRKAPIYWLLQSSKRNYAIWLYYHRLDKDLLFKALVNYVEPKIRLETTRLETLLSDKAAAGESSKDVKRLARDAERQEDFLSELRDFEDKLRRAANLHLDPDLNDGVVLNIAPLHELVPWKEAKKYWDELLAGKYAWSSIGKQLREKGLVH
jgi:hypothetical protein